MFFWNGKSTYRPAYQMNERRSIVRTRSPVIRARSQASTRGSRKWKKWPE